VLDGRHETLAGELRQDAQRAIELELGQATTRPHTQQRVVVVGVRLRRDFPDLDAVGELFEAVSVEYRPTRTHADHRPAALERDLIDGLER